jgi:hypothetical protein
LEKETIHEEELDEIMGTAKSETVALSKEN